MKARVIAFYLPQYHPTIDNDIWWGKGFTEWTNVGKAKPLFRGHWQPKIPADLGYYDLRLSQIREEQAALARDSGIEGFCYYHYWFGNKRQQLELPFSEVVRSGVPDFPFCLCWANESWHQKFWKIDNSVTKKMLIEQKYDNVDGNKEHFFHLLPAFKDPRYITVDGKLLFCIYKPLEFKNIDVFIQQWNELAVENGLKGFYFVGQTYHSEDISKIKSLGLNAVNIVRLFDYYESLSSIERKLKQLFRYVMKRPLVTQYNATAKYFVGSEEREQDIFPTIIPNWDHTPRSGKGGYVINNSTPILFQEHVKNVFKTIEQKPDEYKITFLKSWNEWGEGNYMEPDIRWGRSYLDALKNVFSAY